MPGSVGRPKVRVAPCSFCHRQFKRMEHLRRHERIHTREKPFRCECGLRFSRQDLLARHQRQSHPNTTPDEPTAAGEGALESAATAELGADWQETIVAIGGTVDDDAGDDDRTHDDEPAAFSNDVPPLQDYAMAMTDDPVPDVQQQHPMAPGQGSATLWQDANFPDPYFSGAGIDFLWNLDIDGQAFNDHQFLPTSFLDSEIPLVPLSTGHHPSLHQHTVNANNSSSLASQIAHGPIGTTVASQNVDSEPLNSRLPSLEPSPASADAASQRRDDAAMPPADLEPSSRNASYITPGPRRSQHSGVARTEPAVLPWRLSIGDYRQIQASLDQFRGILPDNFYLPSRHTLSRFLEGYFRGFDAHLPFLHWPTFCPASKYPELIISLAAVGALYRFEHAKGYELYHAARSIISWRLSQLTTRAMTRLTSTSPGHAAISATRARMTGQSHVPIPPDTSWPPRPFRSGDGLCRDSVESARSRQAEGPAVSQDSADTCRLQLAQAMAVLMALTSWGDRDVVSDALAMSSQLATLVREMGVSKPEPREEPTTWNTWSSAEERRRTLCVAYVLFNLQSVAFNVPPMILNQELRVNLPGSGLEWRAASATAWEAARSAEGLAARPFQESLEVLASGRPIHTEYGGSDTDCTGPASAFGNYVLVNGLLQQIFWARNANSCLADSSQTLPEAFIKRMEAGLRAWQESWDATHESTLDPSSPKGPLGFNSTALLRLAYIRLNANLGPSRHLIERDPAFIARAFTPKGDDSPDVFVSERSPHLDRAVLQCIHALSIPVRVGIPFVARTQTLNWSIQHSLSNLECAFLLTHWLRSIAGSVQKSGLASLRRDERKLLEMVAGLIRETDLADLMDTGGDEMASVDVDVALVFGPTDACDEVHELVWTPAYIRRLAALAVALWAETFKGFNVFEMVHIIGTGLSLVADTLLES